MLLINAVNAEGRPVELYVKDGKIAAVGQDLAALAGENETVLDAGGLTVLPAFVDLHCHWRTPGFEYKEDIETGSRAAAAGECPPCRAGRSGSGDPAAVRCRRAGAAASHRRTPG